MHPDLVDVLACPRTGEPLKLVSPVHQPDGRVQEGILRGTSGGEYPIVRGVPRFVEEQTYASTFGSQWQRWASTQVDSVNGTQIFRDRFERYFGDPARLEGMSVLDCGCGAGAFMDVVAPYAERLVGIDLSDSVESAFATVRQHPHADVVQGDLLNLPFPEGSFDVVFCFGVLQHTPDPAAAFASIARAVRPGGMLAVWVYERTRYEWLKPRHMVRRYTAGLPPERAMPFIERYYRVVRPVRRGLRAVPGGRRLAKLAPVVDLGDYAGDPAADLTAAEKREWEVMDTHDMLVTTFDQPQTPAAIDAWFRAAGMEPQRSAAAEMVAMWATKPEPSRAPVA